MLLLVLGSYAQFHLRGKVIDAETSEPLPGAHIIIQDTYIVQSSGPEGRFTVSNLKGGSYAIKVSFVGYSDYEEEIVLDQDINLDIRMEQSVILQDEVIITATRAQAKSPTAYSILDGKEISKTNLGQDMPYIIQMTPSVVTTSDAGVGVGYTGLRIRGTDLFRINVTINGIPLNDAESQGVWWVDLPDLASSVDNIQIQRGVGTSTNGASAFGASINIMTEKLNPKPYAEINTAFGSFNTYKNTLKAGTGLIKDKWAFDVRLSQVHSDGYIDRAFSNLYSMYTSGAYYGKKSLVKFTIFSGYEKTYQAWGGVPGYMLDSNRTYNPMGKYTDVNGNEKYYDNQTDNYVQTHYHLHWAQQYGVNWTSSLALHYTKGKGYYEEYREDESFGDYQLDDPVLGNDTISSTDLIRQRWLNNDFLGAALSFNFDNKKRVLLNIGTSFNYYDGEHFGEIIWARYAVSFDHNYRWYENKGKKNDFNIFVKLNYFLNEKISMYGDLQYRHIDYSVNGIDNDLRDITQTHSYNFINPKLGISADLSAANRLYFSVAVANREPNRSALIDAHPERPSPVHETLYDVETGYKFSSSKLSLDANFFYMFYRDQLVLTGKINDVGDPVMENVPKSFRTGIELSLGWKILKNLSWNTNATLSRNIIRDFISYTDNWDEWPRQITDTLGNTEIAFSPSVIFSSIFNYEIIKDLHLALYSKYVGKQFIDNTGSDDRSLDPYFVNDILISYSLFPKFLKEISFSLKFNNIFNVKYESNAWVYRYYYEGSYNTYDGYFPQAGIHIMGGITLKL